MVDCVLRRERKKEATVDQPTEEGGAHVTDESGRKARRGFTAMYSLPSSQYEQVDALASPSTTAASTHESLEALSRAALLSHASPASVQQQQHNDPVVLSKKPTQQLVPMTTTTLNGRTSPGSVKDEDDTNDTSATLTTTTTTGPTKQHKKRGRKRIEPDAAAVESERSKTPLLTLSLVY